jgi:hypothetical protein
MIAERLDSGKRNPMRSPPPTHQIADGLTPWTSDYIPKQGSRGSPRNLAFKTKTSSGISLHQGQKPSVKSSVRGLRMIKLDSEGVS